MLDAGQQGPQVVAAAEDQRLGRLGGGVDKGPLPLGLPAGDVPAQADGVAPEVLGGLLEGHEHAGVAGAGDPGGQELGGEDGLGAAGGPGHQGGPAAGQAAVGDQVEAVDLG